MTFRLDRIARLGLCFALGLAAVTPVLGQEPTKPTAPPSASNPAVPAAGHSVHGEAFDDGPRRRASLIPGMGRVVFPVTISSPDAQAFINQGVAQLHSFYYLEAERSFRQAALLDPACPMAYWGMSMANVNNAKRAKGFLKEAKAKAKAAKLTRREQLYLETLDALYKEGSNEKANRKEHRLALEAIVAEFPEDLDARAWMSMVAWQDAGADTSRQALDVTLESILDKNPLHPGAHHYRIHLWDHQKAARAEKAAALYAKSAPGIAHAWHMPGHTYTGLKRYADAAYQQEGSARVDHAAMARDRIMPFEIFNYAHNNQWLATSCSHVGRARDAVAVARNLVEQPRDPKLNTKADGGSAQRSGRLRWAEVLCRYELWDDLIAATNAGMIDWSDIPAEKKEKAYTLGLAYAAQGDKAKLGDQVTALRAIVADKSAPPAAAGALAELEGCQKLLDGDIGAAFDLFAKAPAMRPESLSRAHLVARNYGLAESAAKRGVEANAGQVPPLAAYVEVLHVVGKDKEAAEAYRKLEPLAAHADRDTPIFRRLEPLVSGWRSAGGWQPTVAETDDAAIYRVDPSTLGPLLWQPTEAPPILGVDTDGKTRSLADYRGKNVIVLMYLGGKCAHCMQQLTAFGKEVEAFSKAGTEILAVGSDDAESTRKLKQNADGVKFPMPMLADPTLAAFKAYRAYDDFEDSPLHGTFLIDREGKIRYGNTGPEPFLDVEFLKGEAERISRPK